MAISPEHTWPTDEYLLRYVNGELTPAEMREVELHLQECEVCNDVVDGLLLVDNKERIPSIVAELDKMIDARAAFTPVRKFNAPRWLSAAAILIVLTGITYFVSQNINRVAPPLADNQKNPQNENAIVKQDSAPKDNVTVENKLSTKQKELVNNKPIPPAEIKKLEAATKDEAKERVASDDLAKQPHSEDAGKDLKPEETAKNIEGENVNADKKDVFLLDEVEMNTKKNATVVTNEKAVRKASNKSAGVDDAVVQKNKSKAVPGYSNTNNNSYNNTSVQYDSATASYGYGVGISDSSRIANANFYYDNKAYELSIVFADASFFPETSPYYEEAMWLRAKNLIALKKKKEARQVLKDILSLNRKYKNEAETALKNL